MYRLYWKSDMKNKRLFNKARNEQYDESDVCMSVIARFGTGGGNTPIVLETECDEMCSDKEKDMSNETSAIRRITPTECEILQGYPAGWTLIGDPVDKTDKDGNVIDTEYYYTDEDGNKKKVSDSVRYKALGNSICLPFWFYLLRRISAQYERPATLGSLFDGIGGFDFCWAKCNGSKTVLWSSEIEEFPIAVVKKHFGDEKTGEVGDVEKYI